MTLANGTRLGPYEILAPLGAGGMGEVYQARDTRLGRTVAIKVLPEEVTRDTRTRIRFEREARAISALNHPHICTLHDVGRDNEVDYLVMEHCEGKTLARRLLDGPLPTDQVLKFGTQIAEALAKAHRQGIVHRDLKPSNIMLTKSGVKVLDFGLAKERDTAFAPDQSTAQQVSEEGMVLGTVPYMAPEVLNGKEADARSDIFAVGLILYEMVTGIRAFEGTTRASLIAAILERDPKPISELRSNVPAGLVRLIDACLAKDPDQRMESAHDVALELEWCGQAIAQPRVRGRALWIAVAVIAVAAATAAIIAMLSAARPAPNATGVRRMALTLAPDAPITSAVDGNLFAVSPNGERLVYVGPGEALYVRDLNSLASRRIEGTEGSAGPFFSPDGKWVAFARGDEVRKVLLYGGRPVTICDGVTMRGGAWGLDDTIVLGQPARPLLRVSASGGTPQPLWTSGKLRWPAFMDDSGELLLTNYDLSGDLDKNEIAIFNPSTRKLRTLLRGATHGQYSSTGHLWYSRAGTVYRVSLDLRTKQIKGDPEPMLDDPDGFPAMGLAHYAVNGSTVYYLPQDPARFRAELLWVDRGGRVTPAAEERQSYYLPRLSPDQKQVVAHICRADDDCDIWRYEIERGTWNRVTTDGRSARGNWSPDGRSIVYSSNRSGPYNLFVVPSDGSAPSRQLTHGDVWKWASSWSPDGKTIAVYEGRPETDGDIALLSVEGNQPATPYLATAARESDAAFSPDGRWLAYLSSQSGQAELYIRATEGKGPTLKVSNGGGSLPRWQADGTQLFYQRGGALMAVDVRMAPQLDVGKPRLLFEGSFARGFDVTRDGKRFLMVRVPPIAPRTQINVVEGLPD